MNRHKDKLTTELFKSKCYMFSFFVFFFNCLMVVDQFMPMYLFMSTFNFLKDLYFLIENMITTSYIIIKLIIHIGILLCKVICGVFMSVEFSCYSYFFYLP